MSLLVLCEHDRGTLAEAGLEALTAARDLAAKLNVDLEAVLIAPDEATVEAASATAAEYGATRVHLVIDELLVDYGPDAWAQSLGQLIDEVDGSVVVTSGTDRGNEVLANVAAHADLPFVANCLSVNLGTDDDGGWTMTRVQWGGSLLEDVGLSAGRKLLSFAHHGVQATPAAPAPDSEAGEVEVEVEVFNPELDDSVLVTMVQDRDVLSQGVTLASSPVVVSGGRGVGSAEAFAPLEELAALLNGVVGCSRAVTNNGWRPHTDQVGQTGTRIAPEIYIAAGISGAIQHWVGAMASKKILAINTDPEANMVTKADYAVLADLHKIIPAISAEIARRSG